MNNQTTQKRSNQRPELVHRAVARGNYSGRYFGDEKRRSHAVRARPARQETTAQQKNVVAQGDKKRAASSARKLHNLQNSAKAITPDVKPPLNATSQRTKTRPTPKQSTVLHRKTVSKPYKKTHANTQQYVSKSTPLKKKVRPRFMKPLVRLRFTLSLAVLVLVFGVLGSGAALLLNDHTMSQRTKMGSNEVLSESAEAVSSTQTEPMHTGAVSEERPGKEDVLAHSAADAEPKLLRIPAIDVLSRINPVGVNMGNQLELPENIFDTGWYEGSREPSKQGAVLLGGYVSGPNERGSFYYLRALQSGDIVEIETGDGEVYEYEVAAREHVPYDELDLSSIIVPRESGDKALYMVAFDNRYNVLSESFQDRLVIYATQK